MCPYPAEYFYGRDLLEEKQKDHDGCQSERTERMVFSSWTVLAPGQCNLALHWRHFADGAVNRHGVDDIKAYTVDVISTDAHYGLIILHIMSLKRQRVVIKRSTDQSDRWDSKDRGRAQNGFAWSLSHGAWHLKCLRALSLVQHTQYTQLAGLSLQGRLCSFVNRGSPVIWLSFWVKWEIDDQEDGRHL